MVQLEIVNMHCATGNVHLMCIAFFVPRVLVSNTGSSVGVQCYTMRQELPVVLQGP